MLQEVVTSLSRHPLLQATEQGREQALAELRSAEGAFDTTVSFETSQFATGKYDGTVSKGEIVQPLVDQGAKIFAGYRNTSGEIPFYNDELLTGEGGELKAGIRLPLLRDRAIDPSRAKRVRASLERVFASVRIDERKIELTRASSITYWAWVANGERLRIARQLLDVARERGKQLKKRVQHGDLPGFDLDDNTRAVLQREAALLSAQRALQKSAIELSLFLRDEQGKPLIPGPERLPTRMEPPQVRPESDEDRAIRRRPELKKLETELEANQVDLALSENQLLPALDISVAASQDAGAGGKVSNQAEMLLGLRVQFPLQNREASGKRLAAISKREQLKHTRRFLQEKAKNELMDASIAIRLALQKYETAKSEQSLAQSLQSGEQTRFQLGDSNLIFVNLREQTAAEASTRVIDALLEAQLASIEYEAAAARAAEESETPEAPAAAG